jgi:hypothetical protein
VFDRAYASVSISGSVEDLALQSEPSYALDAESAQ